MDTARHHETSIMRGSTCAAGKDAVLHLDVLTGRTRKQGRCSAFDDLMIICRTRPNVVFVGKASLLLANKTMAYRTMVNVMPIEAIAIVR